MTPSATMTPHAFRDRPVEPPERSVASGGAPSGGPDDALLTGWCRRIRQGDEGALEAVFRTQRDPLVRRVAALLGGDVATAHDVVQETFVRLWSHRDRLDPERSLAGWLHRTARNLALNRIRDTGTRAELLAEREAPGPARLERPDEALDRREFSRQMEGWLAELPDRQREAVRLTRFEGLDHREAAEAMDCSPRTVNNHLVRALRTLRACMDRYLSEGLDR